jgi:nucleoside-diphosphate-sugar epimerase
MARVLIVGCGCRGRGLAVELGERGHAVRGTTRDVSAAGEIAAAGAEPVVADPDRLATLLPHIDGVSVVCWLMGSAAGDPAKLAALHGPRLHSLLETLVDTHVRGFVYEGAGSVRPELLERGAVAVRRTGATYRMPVAVVDAQPEPRERWVAEAAAAVERVLGL